MSTPYKLSNKKGIYICPEEGLQPNKFYLVKVASSSSNPVHNSIMYTGFLTKDGKPQGHIYNPTYEPECLPIGYFYYVEVVQLLDIKIL